MHAAFLLGISQYPAHIVKGVPNDLALLARALQHRGYSPDAILMFGDSHTTRAALHELLTEISHRYSKVEQGSCYLHISASGILSQEPLAGGILPSDGNVLDFSTAFSFDELNQYLPARPGIRVVVTLDT